MGSTAGPGVEATLDTSGPSIDSVRRGSVIAGVGLSSMAVLAIVGTVGAVGPVSPDDVARTARDVLAAEGLFRVGVVSLMLVALLDVAVAWGLYRVLAPVDAGLSALAAGCRVVYAGVFLVAIAQLGGAVDLLASSGGAVPPASVQSDALLRVSAFSDLWSAGLTLFGIHLLLVGRLVWRSGYVPRAIGALVVLAGFGYTIDGITVVLLGEGAPQVSAFLFVGEVVLAGWLLWRGAASPAPRRPRPAEVITTGPMIVRGSSRGRGCVIGSRAVAVVSPRSL